MVDQAEDLVKMMGDSRRNFEHKTRIITISSGKGGVGKTNIAVNMGIAFAQLGKKVVVMDADLGLANVNVCLGIIPKFNLYQLIKKQKTMQEIIVDTDYGIQIVAGASGFSKLANFVYLGNHANSTVPIGPLLCFAIMISATSFFSVS